MTIKNLTPLLFALGFMLVLVAIAFLDAGLVRQTVLFLGVVSAIAAMIMRIALLLKNQ